MADGRFLRFEGSGAKQYAKLPAGEYGYGEHGGLYEWRRVQFGDHTELIRIDYTGGDTQASDSSGFFSRGTSAGHQAQLGLRWPAELGFHAALDPARMN